jgi:hypothetical protein
MGLPPVGQEPFAGSGAALRTPSSTLGSATPVRSSSPTNWKRRFCVPLLTAVWSVEFICPSAIAVSDCRGAPGRSGACLEGERGRPHHHFVLAARVAAVEVEGVAVVALLAWLDHPVAAVGDELALGVAGGAVGRIALLARAGVDAAVAARGGGAVAGRVA